jgi:fatty-acyl-CoA synthase
MADFTESPLSPALFLDRAASVFADRIAVIDGERRFTYAEFGSRAHRLAGLLAEAGIHPGDRVAALCVNSHVMLELHNGVPMAGAVLVPMNIRLSAGELTYIMEHSGARLLITIEELADTAQRVAHSTGVRLIIGGSNDTEYEQLLGRAPPHSVPCSDERGLLAINYTSGSTGKPKGVMYSHRGGYLQALAVAYHTHMGLDSVYLWTLPMFHCDGWCFTWAVTAAGATHVCLRKADPVLAWSMICDRGITHLSGAPTVLTMIAEAATAAPDRRPVRTIQAQTGGAPPSPALLVRLAKLNIKVTHLYGLTESYGPAAICEWQPEWSAEPPERQARLNARQGIDNVLAGGIDVFDANGRPVPWDGETMGEIVLRGNNTMIGYYRDDEATRAATINGWFRTGDLGVRHPDGYVELRDRAKDIIITGGENVASVEVERVLVEHPAVLEAAVVGRSDEKWGEVPVAFVVLRQGESATAAELMEFVRSRIAHFKAPKEIRFEELPKTSTGKIQKHVLRERAAVANEGNTDQVGSPLHSSPSHW